MGMRILRPRGFSLIEIILVISLTVGGLLGAALLYRQSARNAANFETVRQVSSLLTNVANLYRNRGDYAGLNTAIAIQNGFIPGDQISVDGARNAYGGDLAIDSQDPFGSFSVVLTALPQDSCARLFTLNGGALDLTRAGRISVVINTETFLPGETRNPAACLPGAVNRIEIIVEKN